MKIAIDRQIATLIFAGYTAAALLLGAAVTNLTDP